MKKTLLSLLCVLAATSSCKAQTQVIDVADVVGLFDYKSTIPVGDNEEKEADDLMALAVKSFTARGFTPGLTGEGYGGPCVIIDGFYKGGTVNTEMYAFEPGSDKDAACVVEMSACNDGDDSDYTLYVSVQLFSLKSAMQFIDQWKKLGFNETAPGENDDRITFTNGKLAVDYVPADGEAFECHFFTIQTAERRAEAELPADANEKDYQG